MQQSLKKIMVTVLLTIMVTVQVTGCGMLDNAKTIYRLLDETISSDNSSEKESGADTADAAESSSTQEDQKSSKPVYSTDHFSLDDSFAKVTEDTVNKDLVLWLNATYAILTEENNLVLDYIGGMSRTSVNITSVFDVLKNEWNVEDQKSLIQAVDSLISQEEGSADPGEDAYCFMNIEQLLGQGYATQMLNMSEYLAYAVPVARMIQSRYSDWDDYGDNYISYYTSTVCNGGYGQSEDIDMKSNIHQLFLESAKYYYGPYLVDYNLDLSMDASATFYYKVDENNIPPGEDRVPIAVLAYTAPKELGTKTTSGMIEIDGDIYHFPATVKAFTDNGWSMPGSSKKIDGLSEDITFSRNGKSILLTCDAVYHASNKIENCLVLKINTYDNPDVDITLPGGIKPGMTKDEVDAILEKYNDREIEESERMGVLQYYIPITTDKDSSSSARIVLTFDGDSKLSYFSLEGSDSQSLSAEGRFDFEVCDNFQENVNGLIEAGEVAQSKKNSDKINVSNDLADMNFQVGMRTFSLPITADELIEGGWHIDEEELEKEVAPGETELMHIYYQDGYYHSALFGYINNTNEPVKLGDALLNYVVLTQYTCGDDNMTVKIANDIQMCVSTAAGVKAVLGDNNGTRQIENGDKLEIAHYYETDTYKYVIITDKDTEKVVEIQIISYQ